MPRMFAEAPKLAHPLRSPRAIGTRLFDLGLAGTILVLLVPLMLLIALAIIAESGRPVFFSQIRLGRGGQLFRMHKFRKFDKRAAPVVGGVLTMENDPRLTRVGVLLVRTKLDELPQLWNVLKGDMAIVGPRPESLDFADCFVGLYRRVLDFKPGIFGPTQAVFRNESVLHDSVNPETFYRAVLFPAKARIDLSYYPSHTVLSDTGCIVTCVLAILGWSRLPQLGKRIVAELQGTDESEPCGGRVKKPSRRQQQSRAIRKALDNPNNRSSPAGAAAFISLHAAETPAQRIHFVGE